MKFLKNSTDKQPKSRWIGYLSPIVTFSFLGLTSGSFGFYLAVNKTFFQDSKAEAIRIPGLNRVDNNARDFISNLEPTEITEETRKNLPQISGISKPESSTIPKRFEAYPLVEGLIAYRIPAIQAKENPSIRGTALTLPNNRFYNITDIQITNDGSYWLKLYSRDPNESVYIDSKKVLCNISYICLGNVKEVENNPNLLYFYLSQANIDTPSEVANNDTPLKIGY